MATPSFYEFMKAAAPANPGVPQADLGRYYRDTYQRGPSESDYRRWEADAMAANPGVAPESLRQHFGDTYGPTEPDPGDFYQGLQDAWTETKAVGGGLVGLGAAAVGANDLRDWGYQTFTDNMAEVEARAKPQYDVDYLTSQGGVGDWVDAAQYQATKFGANVAGGLGVAGLGKAVGQQIAKAGLKKAVAAATAKTVAPSAEQAAAAALARAKAAGSGAEAKLALKEARDLAAGRVAPTALPNPELARLNGMIGTAGTAGWWGGLGAQSVGMEMGSIYGQAGQKAIQQGGTLDDVDLGRVAGYGTAAGAASFANDALFGGLARVAPGFNLTKMMSAPGVGARLAKGAGVGAASGGAIMPGVYAIEQAALENDMSSPEFQHGLRQSAFVGLTGGAVTGGALNLLNRRAPDNTPPPGPPLALPHLPAEPLEVGPGGAGAAPMGTGETLGRQTPGPQSPQFDPVAAHAWQVWGTDPYTGTTEMPWAPGEALARSRRDGSPVDILQLGQRTPGDTDARAKDIASAFNDAAGLRFHDPNQVEVPALAGDRSEQLGLGALDPQSTAGTPVRVTPVPQEPGITPEVLAKRAGEADAAKTPEAGEPVDTFFTDPGAQGQLTPNELSKLRSKSGAILKPAKDYLAKVREMDDAALQAELARLANGKGANDGWKYQAVAHVLREKAATPNQPEVPVNEAAQAPGQQDVRPPDAVQQEPGGTVGQGRPAPVEQGAPATPEQGAREVLLNREDNWSPTIAKEAELRGDVVEDYPPVEMLSAAERDAFDAAMKTGDVDAIGEAIDAITNTHSKGEWGWEQNRRAGDPQWSQLDPREQRVWSKRADDVDPRTLRNAIVRERADRGDVAMTESERGVAVQAGVVKDPNAAEPGVELGDVWKQVTAAAKKSGAPLTEKENQYTMAALGVVDGVARDFSAVAEMFGVARQTVSRAVNRAVARIAPLVKDNPTLSARLQAAAREAQQSAESNAERSNMARSEIAVAVANEDGMNAQRLGTHELGRGKGKYAIESYDPRRDAVWDGSLGAEHDRTTDRMAAAADAAYKQRRSDAYAEAIARKMSPKDAEAFAEKEAKTASREAMLKVAESLAKRLEARAKNKGTLADDDVTARDADGDDVYVRDLEDEAGALREDDGDPNYSRLDPDVPLPRTERQKADVRRVSSLLHGPMKSLARWVDIEIVPTVAEMNLRANVLAPSSVVAMHHRGKVWIVAGNIKDASHAARTLAHEVVGHLGLETVLGREAFTALVQRVSSLRDSEWVKPIVDDLKRAYVDEDGNYNLSPRQEAREILAKLAEKNPNFGLVREAVAMIRLWLAKHGFGNFDRAYVEAMLVAAARYVRTDQDTVRGMAKASAFSRAVQTIENDFKASSLRRLLSDPNQGLSMDDWLEVTHAGGKTGKYRSYIAGRREFTWAKDWLDQTSSFGQATKEATVKFLTARNASGFTEDKGVMVFVGDDGSIITGWDVEVGIGSLRFDRVHTLMTPMSDSDGATVGYVMQVIPDKLITSGDSVGLGGDWPEHPIVDMMMSDEGNGLFEISHNGVMDKTAAILKDKWGFDASTEFFSANGERYYEFPVGHAVSKQLFNMFSRYVYLMRGQKPFNVGMSGRDTGANPGARLREWEWDRVNANFSRITPEAAAKSPAIERLPSGMRGPVRTVIETVRAAADKGLHKLAFTHDLVQMAKKLKLDSVGDLDNLVRKAESVKSRHEQRISTIADKFLDLPGKGVRDQTNRFIYQSTFTQKWGFAPAWKPDAVVDPEMAAAYNALPKQAQDVVREVFQHGHEVLVMKRAAMDTQLDALLSGIKSRLDAAKADGRDDDQIKALFAEYKTTAGMIRRKLSELPGPYAPIKRFGKFAVVGRSERYADLMNRIRDLRAQVDDAEAAGNTARADDLNGQMRSLHDEAVKLQNDGSHYWVEFAESRGEALNVRDRLAEQLGGADYWEKQHWRDGLPVGYEAFQRLRHLVEQGAGDALSSADKRSTQQLLHLVDSLALQALSEQHARQTNQRRIGVAGGDQDMMRAFVTQGQADAHMLSSMGNLREINDALLRMGREVNMGHAGITRDQKTRVANEMFDRYADRLVYRPHNIQDKLAGLTSVWHLVMSPAYYVQNATQVALMGQPYLAQSHGYGRAWGAVMSAYKEVAKMSADTRLFDHYDTSKLPADVQAVVNELTSRNLIDITKHMELGSLATGSETSATGKVARKFDQTIKRLPGKLEMVNRMVTAMAAYRLATQQGLNQKRAVDYAARAVSVSQGDYTGFNAPRFFNPNVVPGAKLITQYRKIQLIQLSFLAKMMHDGLAGASPAERAAAWKGLGYTLGHTMALAGALGLPGANLLSFFMRQYNAAANDEPEDLELAARRGFKEAGMSQGEADLILNGALAPLFGSSFTTRVGMGAVASPLPYTSGDLTSKSGYQEIATAALGPGLGGLGPQFAQAFGSIFQGDYYKGLEQLLPRGLRDLMASYRIGTEGLKTSANTQVVDPEELGLWDMMSVALNLPSADVTRRRFGQGHLLEYEQHFSKRTTSIKRAYTDAYRSGDAAAMREARSDWADLQAAKKRNGFTPSPLSDLLKAPQDRAKNERNSMGGVTYDKGNRRFVQDVTTM